MLRLELLCEEADHDDGDEEREREERHRLPAQATERLRPVAARANARLFRGRSGGGALALGDGGHVSPRVRGSSQPTESSLRYEVAITRPPVSSSTSCTE